MSAQKQKVSIDDVPSDKLGEILAALLERLNLEIVEESTPDYTVYTLEEKK